MPQTPSKLTALSRTMGAAAADDQGSQARAAGGDETLPREDRKTTQSFQLQ